MGSSINPYQDTLWKVAYGKEPTLREKKETQIPKGKIENLAADRIIRRDRCEYLGGRITAIVGSTLFVLGIIFLTILLTTHLGGVSSAVERTLFGLNHLPLGVGVLIALSGGLFWYMGKKRFEEDKNKPLAAIAGRMGQDLTDARIGKAYGNAFEAAKFYDDWNKLFGAFFKKG